MPNGILDYGKIKKQRKLLGLPEDFDPEGNDYDYETALKAGMGPDKETKHWSSRVPGGVDEGQILKGMGHPTVWKTKETEEKANYEIYKSPASGGKYYSRQRRGKGM